MRAAQKIAEFATARPKTVTVVMVAVTLALALMAALPSIWPQSFPMLHPLKIDTDPENMLSQHEAVRIFHDRMKKEFSLYDMVVVGVVNETHPEGVFNTDSLKRIYEIAEYAKTLRWEDEDQPGRQRGVIAVDLIAPSTVDNIEQAGLGTVRFEWLMRTPPETEAEAVAIREKAKRIPFLNGTVLSDDGRALALYLPLTSKDISHKISVLLQEKIATFSGEDQYYITGLPVAEDTFGVEMFKQMAISAPLAMLIIFVLMWVFFHRLGLILSPMIVAMVSVIITMALLVVTGNTVHIMSSMIPIFIMPIAVLDAVHILSEFFDRYQETRDRRRTVIRVMETLFTPMLFTSLTTAVGFGSLALTPIPPVQVFGLFVAFGVLTAWVCTMLFVPAAIMFLKEESLSTFGLSTEEETESSLMSRILGWVGTGTFRHARAVIVTTVILSVVAVFGILKIRINDNPTKWFEPEHPIRVADRVLNQHFGGTYMAYLTLQAARGEEDLGAYGADLAARLKAHGRTLKQMAGAESTFGIVSSQVAELATRAKSKADLLEALADFVNEKSMAAVWEEAEPWDEALLFVDREKQKEEIFKDPEVLRYISRLQEALQTTGIVGKSNSLSDIVKTVHRELFLGEEEAFRIPDGPDAVAQTLITYQNSHRPNDLWHFVTPDYRKTNLWVQLRSGDNQDMERVVAAVDSFVSEHPPPAGLQHQWFGLTYINVVWQNKMVNGMLQAFLSSFLVVMLMMVLLFRSALWGVLSMVPLTVTIGLIYGAIGIVGKDYDMPVAVLSSLSLGLSVDYAIHFLARSKELRAQRDTWAEAVKPVFGEPARAITRNVIVVGVGFFPLLAAPLVPYQTVGVFIAAILFTAGVASLLILPALIVLLEKRLFAEKKANASFSYGTCATSAVLGVAFVAVTVHQFFNVGWGTLCWFGIPAVAVILAICMLVSRRRPVETEA